MRLAPSSLWVVGWISITFGLGPSKLPNLPAQSFSLIKPKFKKEDAIHITMSLGVWVKLIEISGGFTGISFQCILPYLSFGMNSLVGAPVWDSISPSFSREKCLLPSFLLSMKGDVFSVSLSRYSSSFFTVLSSCVAVCTGPEDAIESTMVFLVGEN
ncbi:unnamed protein product [Brassica oleracea]|uniref:(rape) hypothetical protein n=1 Tax=Brassica napus TaxID=3708 RepID=A0A816QW81_BRANA|nr:unnamed protein product [Brassica napus]